MAKAVDCNVSYGNQKHDDPGAVVGTPRKLERAGNNRLIALYLRRPAVW
jgi:hypothetical protein